MSTFRPAWTMTARNQKWTLITNALATMLTNVGDETGGPPKFSRYIWEWNSHLGEGSVDKESTSSTDERSVWLSRHRCWPSRHLLLRRSTGRKCWLGQHALWFLEKEELTGVNSFVDENVDAGQHNRFYMELKCWQCQRSRRFRASEKLVVCWQGFPSE